MKKTQQVHTLVLHMRPDLDALLMVFIIWFFARVRQTFGVQDNFKLKFVPAGPLRAKDWPGEPIVSAAYLEKRRGYLFLDCGGGPLDSHGKQFAKGPKSSLDLLVEACDLYQWAPELKAVCEIISANDKGPSVIVNDSSYRQSSTPHTARHFRSVVAGLNLAHPDEPDKVAALATVALDGLLGRIGRDELTVEAVRPLFLADNLIANVEATLGAGPTADGEPTFRESVEVALRRMEEEWSAAEADYWKNGQLIPVRRDGEEITVAIVHSTSWRAGDVARLGNRKDEVGQLRDPTHPFRPSADVTLQFYGEGKFLISVKNGVRLNKVTAILRQADLESQGVVLAAEDKAKLGDSGHLVFKNRYGKKVQALYFADCLKFFGNAYRTNPFAPLSRLTKRQIIGLTLQALR